MAIERRIAPEDGRQAFHMARQLDAIARQSRDGVYEPWAVPTIHEALAIPDLNLDLVFHAAKTGAELPTVPVEDRLEIVNSAFARFGEPEDLSTGQKQLQEDLILIRANLYEEAAELDRQKREQQRPQRLAGRILSFVGLRPSSS